jgi:hypothetical protein
MFCVASVDYETDGKIQNTIATEFKERTVLCIARKFHLGYSCSAFVDHHVLDRLRTIISYDRICVLDAGTITVCVFGFCVGVLIEEDEWTRNLIPRPACSTLRTEYSGACATGLPSHLKISSLHRSNHRHEAHPVLVA